jgi:hypothetical protein
VLQLNNPVWQEMKTSLHPGRHIDDPEKDEILHQANKSYYAGAVEKMVGFLTSQCQGAASRGGSR